MVSYANGKIYKIVCTNGMSEKIYIGSTTRELSQRMASHRDRAKIRYDNCRLHKDMRDFGIEHFKIVHIKRAMCQSRAELEALEFAVMSELMQEGFELYNIKKYHGMTAPETLKRMSLSHRGFQHSEKTKKAMSINRTNRGCIRYELSRNRWGFFWREFTKQRVQWFPAARYTMNGAHGLAIMAQEKMYPVQIEY